MYARLSELSALSTSRAVSVQRLTPLSITKGSVMESLTLDSAPPPAKVHRRFQSWRAAQGSHPFKHSLDEFSTAHTELSKAPSEFSLRQTDGRPFPFVTFWADIILTYNDRTERTTFNYCTLYTCLQSFWHCREISPLLVLLFVPSFCILRNAE